MKQSEINITVKLDENHIPQNITWSSKKYPINFFYFLPNNLTIIRHRIYN